MTTRKDVIAFRDAMVLGGAQHIRLALGTDDALALARELGEGELKFPEQTSASLKVIDALRDTAEPEKFEEKVAYYKGLDDCARAFWDVFEGQEVSGVEIVRKR